MRCKDCKHWSRLPISDSYLPEDEVGECTGLFNSNIEVEVEAGFNGGYVRLIETGRDFFCANYEDNEQEVVE